MSFCRNLYISIFYPFGIIGIFGVPLNSICVVCFIQLLCRQVRSRRRASQNGATSGSMGNNMFKFLLVKSVIDTLSSAINLFGFFSLSQTYLLGQVVYSSYIDNFILYTMELCSSNLEVGVTFDCWLSIGPTSTSRVIWFFLSNYFFYLFSALSLVYGVVFNTAFWLAVNRESKSLNSSSYQIESNRTYFYVGYESFYYTGIHSAFNLAYYFLRDMITSVLIIILNLLILGKIRKISRLSRKNTATSLTTQQQSKERAERKKSYMIIAISINYSVAHSAALLYPIYSFLYHGNYPDRYQCYSAIIQYLGQVAYSINIVFYYFFNSRFRSILNNNLKLVFVTPFRHLFTSS